MSEGAKGFTTYLGRSSLAVCCLWLSLLKAMKKWLYILSMSSSPFGVLLLVGIVFLQASFRTQTYGLD